MTRRQTDQTYPMATFDIVKALVDDYSDTDIARLLRDECMRRSMRAYAECRKGEKTLNNAEIPKTDVLAYSERALFWKRVLR